MHFVLGQPLFVEPDASQFAIAAILTMKMADGQRKPIVFFSRKLNDRERNWPTYDQEMLAIVQVFETWRQFLEGTKDEIQIFSDHNNLRYFMITKTLTRKQARWAEYLSQFNFKIQYRVGRKNPVDTPSRRPDYKGHGVESELTNIIELFFRLGRTLGTSGAIDILQIIEDIDDTSGVRTTLNRIREL